MWGIVIFALSLAAIIAMGLMIEARLILNKTERIMEDALIQRDKEWEDMENIV